MDLRDPGDPAESSGAGAPTSSFENVILDEGVDDDTTPIFRGVGDDDLLDQQVLQEQQPLQEQVRVQGNQQGR